MIGLMAVVMGSMMAPPALALTVDSIADIYEDQPVGLVIDGLAVDERVRIRVTEDDGTSVLWARGRSMGGGSMTFYGMLPNNTGMVDVVVITNLGSVATAGFDILGACDEDSAFDLGYELGYIDGAASGGGGSDINCFQSSFCYHTNLYWGTGLSASISGPATEAECMDGGVDQAAWESGEVWNYYDMIDWLIVGFDYMYYMCEA